MNLRRIQRVVLLKIYMKLQLGSGTDIKAGWVNHDVATLPGIDVVHDISVFPWPWADGSVTEIYMKDVLEHLSEPVRVLEEIHRITKPGASIFIAVPYWNSWEAITDPTHKSFFNEYTLEFFDPSFKRCQRRPYYSHARFKILQTNYVIKPFGPVLDIPIIGKHRTIKNKAFSFFLRFLASYFNNIIIGLDIYLERI